MKEKWIETKREVEQNKIGEIVKTTIVRERVEPGWKSVIDTGLKLLGISAIFIPLFLFYRQQQVDRENQMINQKSEVYSNLSISLHSLGEQISTYIFDSIPTSNYNLIMFKLIPKALLFDDSNFKKCLVDLRFKTQVYFQISKYIFHCHQIRDNLETLLMSNLYPLKRDSISIVVSNEVNTLTFDVSDIIRLVDEDNLQRMRFNDKAIIDSVSNSIRYYVSAIFMIKDLINLDTKKPYPIKTENNHDYEFNILVLRSGDLIKLVDSIYDSSLTKYDSLVTSKRLF